MKHCVAVEQLEEGGVLLGEFVTCQHVFVEQTDARRSRCAVLGRGTENQ